MLESEEEKNARLEREINETVERIVANFRSGRPVEPVYESVRRAAREKCLDDLGQELLAAAEDPAQRAVRRLLRDAAYALAEVRLHARTNAERIVSTVVGVDPTGGAKPIGRA